MKRAMCIVSLAAMTSACPKDETPTPPPADAPAAWQIVFDAPVLDRALLSVWGTGARDVFAVGGSLGNGRETLALHFDGDAWRELHPGGTETFWWVNGSSSTDVWMTGTNGRIAHWDGNTFKPYASGTTATIWGVFAFAPNDAWCVGGTPEGGTAQPNDVVLHFDGTDWKPEALPGAPLGRSLYKVWGTSSNDLWVSGEYGTIWHRAGTAWSLVDTKTLATGTLFTVWGCGANDVWSVGGSSVLHYDGTSWSAQSVDLNSQVFGVSCLGAGQAAIVGGGGLKQRLVGGKWIDEFTVPPGTDLHATWGDPQENAYWAVGGDFLGGTTPGAARRGVLVRYGAGEVPTTLTK